MRSSNQVERLVKIIIIFSAREFDIMVNRELYCFVFVVWSYWVEY
jgi:hypothetical protein